MNGDTALAELLSVALRQRDQAVEAHRLATLQVKELEAKVAELEPKTNGRVRKPVAS